MQAFQHLSCLNHRDRTAMSKNHPSLAEPSCLWLTATIFFTALTE